MLPAPILQTHGEFVVVRDDLLPGGTKRRAIASLFREGVEEYIYVSPVYGLAQLALAYAARDAGVRATVFCAKRKDRHLLTQQAEKLGAQIKEIEFGRMSVLRARAREYAQMAGRPTQILPFGLDHPTFVQALAVVASAIEIEPREVWCAAGSGVLTRALQIAWPNAEHRAVRVGALPSVGFALLYEAPETYEETALVPPPFPSNPNYDGKVWRFMLRYARPGALMWNVAS